MKSSGSTASSYAWWKSQEALSTSWLLVAIPQFPLCAVGAKRGRGSGSGSGKLDADDAKVDKGPCFFLSSYSIRTARSSLSAVLLLDENCRLSYYSMRMLLGLLGHVMRENPCASMLCTISMIFWTCTDWSASSNCMFFGVTSSTSLAPAGRWKGHDLNPSSTNSFYSIVSRP